VAPDTGPEARARLWFWRVWTAIGVAVAIAGLWWLLHEPLFILLGPLALALVFVYLLNPIVGWLHTRRVPRPLGTAFAYLVGIGALVAFLVAIGPILARQVGGFAEELPSIAAAVGDGINRQMTRLGLAGTFSVDLTESGIQEVLAEAFGDRDQLDVLLRGIGAVAGRVFHGVVTIVLAPFLAFYILADLPRIQAGMKRLLPPGQRNDVVDVAQRILTTVGSYFRGQLLVASFVGVATSIGLAVVGLPFWALVGGIAGVFNLVPLIGPFVGGVIGVIVALTVGAGVGQAVAVIVVMVAVQQVDNHVITPNIVSRTVKIHPVTVMLGLLVAGSMYGILGMLVAIPVIATVKLVLMYVLVTRVPSMRHLAGEEPNLFDGAPPTGEDGTLLALGRDLRSAWERRREDGRRSERARVPAPSRDPGPPD
jgi:predicted PurR-regulated permease PerM